MLRLPQLSFSAQIIVALILGVLTGLFFGEKITWINYFGIGFIKLLQIPIIPYIVLSLVAGFGSLEYQQIKKIATRFCLFLCVLWGIGLLVVFAMSQTYPDWQSAAFFSINQITPPQAVNYYDLYIPSNPFKSLTDAAIPAVVVFSILLGIVLIGIEEKHKILQPVGVLLKALGKMNSLIVKLLPLGIFAISAAAAGTIEAEVFGKLQVYLMVFMISAVILSFWILPLLVSCLTPFKYSDIIVGCRNTLMMAFVTGNLFILLPLLVKNCDDIFRSHHKLSETANKYNDILIPIAFNFPAVGKILALTFILFSAWFTNNDFDIAQLSLLTVNGILSLFASNYISLPFLLNFMHLPADVFQLYMAGNVITSRFATLTSAVSILTLTLITTAFLEGLFKIKLRRLLFFVSLTAGIITMTVLICQIAFTRVIDNQHPSNAALQHMQVDWESSHKIKVEVLAKRKLLKHPSSPQDIINKGKLRLGFDPQRVPFSYININHELVGFDIEMFNYLATSLGIKLEFIPFYERKSLFGALENHQIDIAISGVQINEHYLHRVLYTQPTMDLTLALVVPDYRKREFSDYANVLQMQALKVATLSYYARMDFIQREYPQIKFEIIASADEYFETKGHDYDAFMTSLEAGMTMVMMYPEYAIAFDKTRINRFPVGYAVAKDNVKLHAMLNSWLDMQQSTGRIKKLYDYWIQGKGSIEKQPRWSIIENVLKSAEE